MLITSNLVFSDWERIFKDPMATAAAPQFAEAAKDVRLPRFGNEQLTSYGGLELLRRYFELIGLSARIRRALGKHAGGDYGSTHCYCW